MSDKLTLKIDIDGVLCNNTYGDTENAEPRIEAIQILNKYREKGAYIIIETGRPVSKIELTKNQLEKWGVQYDELKMAKIQCDWTIDDRAMKSMLEFDLAVEFAKDGRFTKT